MTLIRNFLFLWLTATFVYGGVPKVIEELLCEDNPCFNGGSCAVKADQVACLCPPEYTGQYCESLSPCLSKSCPKMTLATPCPPSEAGLCHEECKVDSDCGVNEKCCLGSCGFKQCYKPIDCQWSEWSACKRLGLNPSSCGEDAGKRFRIRNIECISVGEDIYFEEDCLIPCPTSIPSWEKAKEERRCDLLPCPPCPFENWGPWGPCSVSCGSGQRKRTRRVQKIDDNCDDGQIRPETQSENCWNSQCPNLDCVDEFRQCAKQGNQVCTVPECYQGKKSATLSGRTCQRWNSQNPQQHSYSSGGNHNHCRNPSNDTAPWCYTTDPDLRWDYCFPDCDPTPCRDKDSPAACADAVAREMCLPCHRNFYKTIVNCCLSCKKSQNPHVEQLADDRCARWAKSGRCSNSVQVQHNCAHLCRIC